MEEDKVELAKTLMVRLAAPGGVPNPLPGAKELRGAPENPPTLKTRRP